MKRAGRCLYCGEEIYAQDRLSAAIDICTRAAGECKDPRERERIVRQLGTLTLLLGQLIADEDERRRAADQNWMGEC